MNEMESFFPCLNTLERFGEFKTAFEARPILKIPLSLPQNHGNSKTVSYFFEIIK